MLVRLGYFVTPVEFIVFDKLVVALRLCVDYCEKFVEATYPRKKKVVFEDYSEVLIILRAKLRQQKPGLQTNGNKEFKKAREPPHVRVSRSITIEPGSQAFVYCTSKRSGLVVVQHYGPLYEKNSLVAEIGVIQVDDDKPFKRLIANYGIYLVQVQKNQVVS